MKERQRYREGASAKIDDKTEKMMKKIRETVQEYGPDLTYNIDKSGYYWKMKPDCSLSTFETKRTKKAKAQITANFCTNVTGTDKLPVWFISTAKRLNCFRARGL
jgi:hypothetical protein